MTVDIICKVVDNLGDIGFAYRLARSLSELPDAPSVRLVVDDLASFASLCPGVDPSLPFQTVGEWIVSRWDDPGPDALSLFRASRPRSVIECYSCGHPEWFNEILFDPGDPEPRHIVNLEYLTAEPWARDFHLLPSLTADPRVKKSFFMPGLVEGTGGLLIDSGFSSLLDAAVTDEGRARVRGDFLARAGSLPGFTLEPSPAFPPPVTPESLARAHWTVVFSYEHDFASLVADLASFARETPLAAFVAAGRSSACFFDAWERAGRPFAACRLPMLPQPLWDSLLVASDFAIVRGEESFARAILAGKPFLWECYPFAGGGEPTRDAWSGHFPKIRAFLDLLRPYLSPGDSARYERLTLAFNGFSDTETVPGDLLAVLRSPEMTLSFAAMARDARKLGNLAVNLMTFLRDFG
jgi:uncharacterized repeat protein (TIGR03837 family)